RARGADPPRPGGGPRAAGAGPRAGDAPGRPGDRGAVRPGRRRLLRPAGQARAGVPAAGGRRGVAPPAQRAGGAGGRGAGGAPVIEVLYVEGAAAYLGLLGRHEQAYRLLAGAEAWRHRLKVPVAPVNVERQGRLGRMLENRLDAYTRASLEVKARQATPEEL